MTTLFDPSTFLAFTVAAIALVVAPGPGQALVLTRTLQGGLRPGLLTALGLELGTVIHIAASSLGLSAILLTSAVAFDVVKYVGAAYLLFLGVLAWRRSGKVARVPPTDAAPVSSPRLLLHAAVTGTLNPKVALFFLAFLPQFVDARRGHVLAQFLVLGLTFAVLGLVGDSIVALLGAGARHRVVGAAAWTAWRERLTGAVLIALGLRLAAATRN